MKPLDELLDSSDDVWREIERRIDAAEASASILPLHAPQGAVLELLQLTTGSTLGAIVYHSGGIVLDNGWVRLHGGGHDQVLAVAEDAPGVLVIGHDVVGGRFALNGGALGGDPGEVNYWAPDSLEWDPIGLGYTDFVHAFLGGATAEFYASLRWTTWVEDLADVQLDQGVALYPPPFSKEGQDVETVHRAVVPLDELHSMYANYAAQLNG